MNGTLAELKEQITRAGELLHEADKWAIDASPSHLAEVERLLMRAQARIMVARDMLCNTPCRGVTPTY